MCAGNGSHKIEARLINSGEGRCGGKDKGKIGGIEENGSEKRMLQRKCITNGNTRWRDK